MKNKKLSKMLISALLATVFTLTGCGGNKGELTVNVIVNQKYEVSFDYNFDTTESPLPSVEVTAGKTYANLPSPTVEKEGCHFVGWNTRADGLGKSISADSIVNYSVGDHVLYAVWAGNEYTLSFDLGGGNINGATQISTRKVTYGEIYGMFAIPSDPQKYMAKFGGWYLNPNGDGSPITINTLVREPGNHTLYAIFRDIRFHYDFTDPTEIKDFYSYGNSLDYQIVQGENNNYLEISNTSQNPTGYLVLDSVFTAGTKITIDAEFVGTVDDVEIDDRELEEKKVKAGMFCYGANGDGSSVNRGELGVPGAPTTPDHVNKWYWGQGARTDPWEKDVWNGGHMVFVVNILENCYGLQFMMEFGKRKVRDVPDELGVDWDTDTSLWHNNKWRINSIDIDYVMPEPELPAGTEVKINFDLNYQTDETAPESVTAIVGDEIENLPELEDRDGYSFVGWNTSPDGKGKTYSDGRNLISTKEEITLYAIWEGDLVNVSFDLCGGNYKGVTELESVNVQLGTPYTDELIVTPTKDGFNFGGWYLNPNGEGKAITGATTVETIEDHTLYAYFIEKVDNINYFDFSNPSHAMYFTALNGLSLGYKSDERGGYLDVSSNSESPSGQIALMKPLTAGTTVDVDLEFIGEVDDVSSTEATKLRAGAFFYGAGENGFGLDTHALGVPGAAGTPDYINKWYWGQGARNDPWETGVWNNGHIEYTINILEDCYGISIYFEFGVKKDASGAVILDSSLWENNKWRINSIIVSVPGIETEYSFELNGGNVNGATSLDKVETVTGNTYGNLPTPEKDGYMFVGWYQTANGTGKPVTADTVVKNGKAHTLYAIFKEIRLVYDFTTPDQLNDFINVHDGANFEVVTDGTGTYLKVSSLSNTSLNAKFSLVNIFLEAGSSVEFDVEFVGTYDSSNRAGFFTYGAKQDGSNIVSGSLGIPGADGTPDSVNKWYWGQGYHSNDSSSLWQNGKFTVTTNILEDCHGVYCWAQMGNDAENGYWKITAIRINLA